MDRRLAYNGALPSNLDVNQNAQFAMVSDGNLAQATMGSGTWADGLPLTATGSPSMSLVVGPGRMGAFSVVDQTNPGSAAIADTADALMKIGINLGSTTIAFTAPGTTGQSQVFLIQGQMQESDTGSATFQYWNSTTPSVPLTGPGGSGASQNTLRVQRVVLQSVAGAPAATGSQTAPSATTGWSPLYLVTLANGQTTITSGSFAVHPSAPFVDPTGTGRGIRGGRLLNVRTIGASGTYAPSLGTNSIEVELVGGGGAGGGSAATGTSQVSAGAGAGAGGYARKRITSGFAGATITIGAGGTAVSGGAGGAGGTTSLGAIVSATGGAGGSLGPAAAPSGIPVGAGAGGAGVGGDVNGVGGAGGYAVYTTPATGGAGGGSFFGAGGAYATASANGTGAITPGSGGGGGNQSVPGAPASTGGNGAAGIVIIREYA